MAKLETTRERYIRLNKAELERLESLLKNHNVGYEAGNILRQIDDLTSRIRALEAQND